ncbi:MAG: hypothetical protein KDA84_14435, partial [Planctomycetaceae bacterium]|nr:hypothetical protein [Planctomycetaceae bacterium]
RIGSVPRKLTRVRGRLHTMHESHITATIFSTLGMNSNGHFTDNLGRQIQISTGRRIETIYQ